MLMITCAEIEQKRSPTELHEFVVQLLQSVRDNEIERHRGIQKDGIYKLFVDEIIPLSHFSRLNYPESYKILPVIGNQGYDALVFNADNKEVDRVEITIPHNGAATAKDARMIVEQGYSDVHIADGNIFLKDMALNDIVSCVLDVCHKKSRKDYSDCSLVIVVALNPPFPADEAQYNIELKKLINEIKLIKFNAKKVFFLIPPCKLTYSDGNSEERPAKLFECR